MALSPEDARLFAAFERRLKREEFTPEKFFFDKQLAVWKDPARFQTLDGSRRIGKTDLASGLLLWDGLQVPGSLQIYVAPSRVDARDTVWNRIKQINETYGLGFIPHEGPLNLTHPEKRSEIRFRGAKDAGQAQRLRGPPQGYHRAIVDEAQNHGATIRTVLTDALLPAMTGGGGVRGRILTMGTPSLVKVGFWHDLVHRSDASWSHHRWTIRDNPNIHDAEQVLAEAARMLGGGAQAVGELTPSFRREWLGEWVTDLRALVFQFDPEVNYFDELPAGHMETVIGVDLGHHPDSSAIDVEGWFPGVNKELFGVEEWVQGDCDLDDVADALEERIERYRPVAVVVDEGGLGKMIAETMRRRRGISCQPAEKFDKLGAISVFNNDLRQGLVKVRRGAYSAHDMAVVRWDEKARDERGEMKVAKKPHSDIMDAKVYAHRKGRHYLYAGPPAAAPAEPDALEAARAALITRRAGAEWWEADAESMGVGWHNDD